ncbi:VOC family protein [Desulfonatronovibrio magnus]|uniref:VOC family protein n=1 Tax=Desulfonatronovibrio magnus TaxID=698827 RepID=UPI0005EBDD9C|nr:VOC family protein [Desulfonatronovibrio magnus]RQD61818.1 MAG: VOC family protein [Desulfonatronovibrio sp. MSAO_Bac4]
MKIKGINHIALVTSNMDQTILFWRDLIGLRLIAGLGKPGYRQYFFEAGHLNMLLFFEWNQVEPIPEKDHGVPVKGPFAFDHLALEVEQKDDLWEIYDRLSAAEIWVSEVMDHGFIYSVYSFDPNNIAIEFSWTIPDSDLDLHQNPKMLDLKPTYRAMQGPQPVNNAFPEASPTSDGDKRVYPGEGSEFRNRRNKW